jgi:hypothetical protein
VGGIAVKAPHTSEGSAGVSNQVMAESFLVLDTQRKDHAGKGIINIYAGVKWGYRLQVVQS